MARSSDASLRPSPAYRRNPFEVEPAVRPMPSKALSPDSQRMKPSVSRDVAELAAHLGDNPVFVDLLALLRKEATTRLTDSPLGAEGATVRETARYELEALASIETRIASMGAEIQLHAERE